VRSGVSVREENRRSRAARGAEKRRSRSRCVERDFRFIGRGLGTGYAAF